jgi:hypothetical protein
MPGENFQQTLGSSRTCGVKEPERRRFRKEVVFGAKYFHEHNFADFIADTVGLCHSLIVFKRA